MFASFEKFTNDSQTKFAVLTFPLLCDTMSVNTTQRKVQNRMKLIKTERLTLSPLSPADEKGLLSILADGDVQKTYMIPENATQAQMQRIAQRIIALSHDSAHFTRGIYLQDTLIGLVNDVEVTDDHMELGYAIHPAHWNRGYATEMLKAASQALFARGFSAVRAGAFSQNTASLRVMEKCGMKKLAETETITYRGAEHLCIYYALEK